MTGPAPSLHTVRLRGRYDGGFHFDSPLLKVIGYFDDTMFLCQKDTNVVGPEATASGFVFLGAVKIGDDS
jgi:hypothetical protein